MEFKFILLSSKIGDSLFWNQLVRNGSIVDGK